MAFLSFHVVFDTNVIWAKQAHVFLDQPAAKLIKNFSAKPQPPRWYLPWVVKAERDYQMIARARELRPAIRDAERLFGPLFTAEITDELIMQATHRECAN